MSDPDGLGATPTHEADTQALDHELWEAEGVLRVPPHVGGMTAATAEEDQPAMEGGAVRVSRIQEKRHKGSPGSTALPVRRQQEERGVAPPVSGTGTKMSTPS